MRCMSCWAPRARARTPPAAEHATIEDAVEDGRARAREVLEAGLGQYAASIQVVDPALDDGSVLVEVRGSMPLFFGGPGQDTPVQLPLDARARTSREFFRPQATGATDVRGARELL